MRPRVWITLLLLAAGPAWAGMAAPNLAAEARSITDDFMRELKGRLTTALGREGPAGAVGICREVAPALAARLAAERGWTVGRTSLRLRQPDNAPDPWEHSVLLSFEARRVAGEDPAGMEQDEVLQRGEATVYRYMKAIPTGELCLLCHGESLAPEVRAALERLYPEDRATGFEVGQIRGAFTLSRVLPAGEERP